MYKLLTLLLAAYSLALEEEHRRWERERGSQFLTQIWQEIKLDNLIIFILGVALGTYSAESIRQTVPVLDPKKES